MSPQKPLLSIVELGGYPDFNDLYKRYGYEPIVVFSMRKALGTLKKISHKLWLQNLIINLILEIALVALNH